MLGYRSQAVFLSHQHHNQQLERTNLLAGSVKSRYSSTGDLRANKISMCYLGTKMFFFKFSMEGQWEATFTGRI